MATNKKPITFYASDKVQKWYQSLPPQAGTREINRLLEAAIQDYTYKEEPTLEERVKRLEEIVSRLNT